MFGNSFDPFSEITNDSGDSAPISPGVHVGVVKRYIENTNSCMVLVPTVNANQAIGPVRVMSPFSAGLHSQPTVGMTVIVAFMDSEFINAVVLGYFA